MELEQREKGRLKEKYDSLLKNLEFLIGLMARQDIDLSFLLGTFTERLDVQEVESVDGGPINDQWANLKSSLLLPSSVVVAK